MPLTFFYLTLDELDTMTLEQLDVMEMGTPPKFTPWHCQILFTESETAEVSGGVTLQKIHAEAT